MSSSGETIWSATTLYSELELDAIAFYPKNVGGKSSLEYYDRPKTALVKGCFV
jgi:hypothetical protein